MEVKYELVKQTLRQEIISGKYQINEKLPTESQLMARFNVSRYTIRRAVGELENEHYVYRVQGVGCSSKTGSAIGQPMTLIN